MAKLKALPDQKSITSINYRIERKGSFAWRPVRLTIFTDGSTSEETAFKEDTIDIVMRKLGLLMRNEGNVDFSKGKVNAV